MIAYFLSKLITMFYGMLYPAYCSYKAVKTKDVKEYVHWMMYWIVFSIFSVLEVFSDTFIGLWFPFYYELKILFMIWMLSPSTRGGSTLYRRLIHPFLTRHEPQIDDYLAEFKLRTSSLIVQWGSRAFTYATEMIMNAAYRGGAGDFRFMSQKLSRTYSYENFDQPDMNRNSFPAAGTGEILESSQSDMEFPFPNDVPTMIRQRNIYSSNMRFGSVDENLGRMGDMSQPPFSVIEESQGEELPKLRSSSRKKKEGGAYGTLPRTKRTSKRPHVQ